MTPTSELRRLLAEATPGPVRLVDDLGSNIYVGDYRGLEMGKGYRPEGFTLTAFITEADAALIVAAVNALPALLDRIEEQEKTREIYRMLIGPLLDRLEEQEKTLEMYRMLIGPRLADGTLT